MALTITKLFNPTVLSGSGAAVLFTVPTTPGSNTLKNARMRLTNTSAGPVTASLYAGPAAAPSDATTCFLAAVSIAANTSLEVDVPTLAAGDTLRGQAGAANSITAHEMGGVLYS